MCLKADQQGKVRLSSCHHLSRAIPPSEKRYIKIDRSLVAVDPFATVNNCLSVRLKSKDPTQQQSRISVGLGTGLFFSRPAKKFSAKAVGPESRVRSLADSPGVLVPPMQSRIASTRVC